MACLTNYTIQCTDATTGQTGCFLFDVPHWQKTGEFKAVGPVHQCVSDFFKWDNANGVQRKSIFVERTVQTNANSN